MQSFPASLIFHIINYLEWEHGLQTRLVTEKTMTEHEVTVQEHDYSTTGLTQADYFAFYNASESIISNNHLWHTDWFFSAVKRKSRICNPLVTSPFFLMNTNFVKILDHIFFNLQSWAEKRRTSEFLTISTQSSNSPVDTLTHAVSCRSTN